MHEEVHVKFLVTPLGPYAARYIAGASHGNLTPGAAVELEGDRIELIAVIEAEPPAHTDMIAKVRAALGEVEAELRVGNIVNGLRAMERNLSAHLNALWDHLAEAEAKANAQVASSDTVGAGALGAQQDTGSAVPAIPGDGPKIGEVAHGSDANISASVEAPAASSSQEGGAAPAGDASSNAGDAQQ